MDVGTRIRILAIVAGFGWGLAATLALIVYLLQTQQGCS